MPEKNKVGVSVLGTFCTTLPLINPPMTIFPSHKNLKALNDWRNSTGVLHLWVNFQNRTGGWVVRVLANTWGKAHPIRTCTGVDLETVCVELLPKAQERFEQQKAKILHDNKEYQKREARRCYQDKRDIEAMHHIAEDF